MRFGKRTGTCCEEPVVVRWLLMPPPPGGGCRAGYWFPRRSWNPVLKEHCETCARPEPEEERQSVMYACPATALRAPANTD